MKTIFACILLIFVVAFSYAQQNPFESSTPKNQKETALTQKEKFNLTSIQVNTPGSSKVYCFNANSKVQIKSGHYIVNELFAMATSPVKRGNAPSPERKYELNYSKIGNTPETFFAGSKTTAGFHLTNIPVK